MNIKTKTMKQTAVEWLIKELKLEGYDYTIQQAKEMEKQQIIDAHGNKVKKSAGVTNYLYTLTGEKYYNETYGSNGSDEKKTKQ